MLTCWEKPSEPQWERGERQMDQSGATSEVELHFFKQLEIPNFIMSSILGSNLGILNIWLHFTDP